MTKFALLDQIKQSPGDFFKIRCKNCLMPNFIAKWNDPDGNTCTYCSPNEDRLILFPTDMSNDNSDMSLDDLMRLIRSQNNANHDCLVSLTGGRDSTYILYYVKEILGLNPIAFNFHTGFVTDIAQENMVNVTKALGVDFIQLRLDWKFQKKLARGFFNNNGEVCSICHQGYFYTVQKVAQWTGLKIILRGLCKKTEANYIVPDYVNWYCLSDEDFNARVNAFAELEGISKLELEKHKEYLFLRDWTDSEVKRIDLPDIIDYSHDKVLETLSGLNWRCANDYIHLDCLFAPILVCCQRVADGYSKKQIAISNLVLNGMSIENGIELLLAEENIGFDDLVDIDKFLNILDIDLQCFQQKIKKHWSVRASTSIIS